MRLTATERREANGDIFALEQYRHDILTPILSILEDSKLEAVNEDGTSLGIILCGREGRANIDIAKNGEIIDNSMLALTWHKMPSGKYEVVAYLT